LSRSDFFDLRSLFGFRDRLNRLESVDEARAVLVHGPGSIQGGRVGILPGSFNPPTSAHLALALAAHERFKLDTIVFSLSSVIVDKEVVEGLCHEDRLLLLGLISQQHEWLAAAVTNRGLYYQQVPGFRELFGKKTSIYFIVGMDKVVQIFDSKYYEDRDAALTKLFVDAQLIAANRGEWHGDDLEALLARDENQAYEGRLYPLALPPSLKDLSSTAVREAVRKGVPYEQAVPDLVADFISTTGAYRDVYEVRAAAIQSLFAFRSWAEDEVDLERVVASANEQTTEGRFLHHLLCQVHPSEARLKEVLVRLPLCRSS
jgi:nicotinic acid mononucleotide adenylyltransferase